MTTHRNGSEPTTQIEQTAVLTQTVLIAARIGGAEEWANAHLTVSQLRALLLLQQSSPLKVNELADQLGVHITSAGQLLDRLVRRGLVSRSDDPEDRRVVYSRISPEGTETLMRLYGSDKVLDALRRLDADSLSALHKGMQALADAIAAAQ